MTIIGPTIPVCESYRVEITRLRDALDRISRFDECFANIAGVAMAEALAKYARKVLENGLLK